MSGRAKRMVDAALEDFGVRRRRAAPVAPAPCAPVPVAPVATVVVPIPQVTPPVQDRPPAGVVWQGPARRRPELQRFCEHLATR